MTPPLGIPYYEHIRDLQTTASPSKTASLLLLNSAFQSLRISGLQIFTMDQRQEGELNWRLSAHPITLLVFLGIRIGSCCLLQLTTKGTPD